MISNFHVTPWWQALLSNNVVEDYPPEAKAPGRKSTPQRLRRLAPDQGETTTEGGDCVGEGRRGPHNSTGGANRRDSRSSRERRRRRAAEEKLGDLLVVHKDRFEFSITTGNTVGESGWPFDVSICMPMSGHCFHNAKDFENSRRRVSKALRDPAVLA